MKLRQLTCGTAAVAICIAGVLFSVPARTQVSRPPGSASGQFGPAAPSPKSLAVQRQDTRMQLILSGRTLVSQKDVEMYLAYQAATQTMAAKYGWFTFIERHGKGDNLPVSRSDPDGVRYSFRMEYFRPAWRYKTSPKSPWKNWNRFSSATFLDGTDPAAVTQFEVTAALVLHKGMVDGGDPFAFDGSALSQFLVNQVSPPK